MTSDDKRDEMIDDEFSRNGPEYTAAQWKATLLGNMRELLRQKGVSEEEVDRLTAAAGASVTTTFPFVEPRNPARARDTSGPE